MNFTKKSVCVVFPCQNCLAFISACIWIQTLIGEREQAKLVVQTARFFYLYIDVYIIRQYIAKLCMHLDYTLLSEILIL